MKKLLAMLLVLAMALSMVACSGKSDNGLSVGVDDMITDAAPTWDTSKEDEIVISAMANYYESGWKMMAEEYMKLHPETTVTVDVVADNDTLTQKFVTWFASDDLTDASDITHINFAGSVGGSDLLMERGQVYDFTKLIDTVNPYTGTVMRDYLYDEDIAAFTRVHGVSAVPFDHVAVAMMVNVDLLKEHGLEVPKTMEDLIAACAKLKEGGVETPILATPEGSYFISVLGDAAMRDMYGDFIYKTTDEGYDPATMAANDGYKYDPAVPGGDKDLKINEEAKAAYIKANGFDTDLSLSIWEEYAKLHPYFNANYLASASTDVLTSFEMQNGAFLISGSWNVGVLNKDVQEMGEDGFEWVTVAFPSYANKPEGWATGNIRSLYVMGNEMGIIKTKGDDADHLARVIDFYQFVYNPVGCAMMFEKTLADGYFVQGNTAIKGVTLPEDVTAKLEGFYQEAPMRSDLDALFGKEYYMSEDMGTYREFFNKLGTELDAASFMAAIKDINNRRLDDNIDQNNWDLNPATKEEHK